FFSRFRDSIHSAISSEERQEEEGEREVEKLCDGVLHCPQIPDSGSGWIPPSLPLRCRSSDSAILQDILHSISWESFKHFRFFTPLRGSLLVAEIWCKKQSAYQGHSNRGSSFCEK
ncbi:unnamed protein product, partial [Musa textilis]